MRPDNIITCDADGKKVGGAMPRHNEVYIHSEVLRARPDVQCVIHSHPVHAVAFSSLGRPLVAVGNDAVTFAGGRLPIFSETTDLIVNPERGKAVAHCLGPHDALILRNHGIAGRAGRTSWGIRSRTCGARNRGGEVGDLLSTTRCWRKASCCPTGCGRAPRSS